MPTSPPLAAAVGLFHGEQQDVVPVRGGRQPQALRVRAGPAEARLRVGVARCARRGDVRVVGLSSAPIPWPVGQTLPRGAARALVLFDGLAEPVRRESATAVAYWWGVTAQTVTAWRRALGVGQYNEGTTRLKSEILSPVLDRAREASLAKASCPERCARIAASKRGKPRPPHVVEAMRQGHLGKPHDEATRRKMSEAHPAARHDAPRHEGLNGGGGRGGPGTAAPEAAQRTGRTLTAVYSRRRVHGLPDGRAGRKGILRVEVQAVAGVGQ